MVKNSQKNIIKKPTVAKKRHKAVTSDTKILKNLYSPVREHIKLENSLLLKLNFDSSAKSLQESEEIFKQLQASRFASWLQKNESFILAKKKMLKKKLITKNNSAKEYFSSLEIVCAHLFHHITELSVNNGMMERMFILPKEKRKKIQAASKKLKNLIGDLVIHPIFAKQIIFSNILDDFTKLPEINIFTYYRKKDNILRTTMMRLFITYLLTKNEYYLTQNYIADTSILIANMLFDEEISKSYAINLTRNMVFYYNEEKRFRLLADPLLPKAHPNNQPYLKTYLMNL